MSGGIFTAQNKVRPGAYINFKGVSQGSTKLGVRGVMTMPVPMSWGAQVTELLSTDLVDGKSLAKIGFTALDAESLLFRLALANCYKAVIYRLDSGGVAAAATMGDFKPTARYKGVVGNSISVAVITNGGNFDVITYYKGSEKDKQTVANSIALVDNDWIDFGYTSTGVLTANAGTNLTGGLNGTISPGNYTAYFATIQSYNWNTMAIPQDDDTAATAAVALIKSLRDNAGRKVQVVVFDQTNDHEGVISVEQGFKTLTETITPPSFAAYYAGLTAGAGVSESNTYKVIEGATEIVYDTGVTPFTNDVIIAKLQLGRTVLSTILNGNIVVEQDINSLHTFVNGKTYAFSKNRVIRTLDEINNTVSMVWASTYVGKVSNNADGRTLFKGDLIQYLNQLQSVNAIQDFDSQKDIEVLAGTAIDAVVVNIAIKPVDAMEKLYMTVLVG